jgi:hypothetical protein
MGDDFVEKGLISCKPSRCCSEVLSSSVMWSAVWIYLEGVVGDVLALSPTFAVAIMTARTSVQTATTRRPFAVAFCLAFPNKWLEDCDMNDCNYIPTWFAGVAGPGPLGALVWCTS